MEVRSFGLLFEKYTDDEALRGYGIGYTTGGSGEEEE
jgi:hypothetical protein